MSSKEQRRTWVISRLMAGELGIPEAAHALGLSERSIRRLRARMEPDGPAGLVHGNRGRTPRNRLSPETEARVVQLAAGTYAGVNDSHLAELLAEREGITVSRAALRVRDACTYLNKSAWDATYRQGHDLPQARVQC